MDKKHLHHAILDAISVDQDREKVMLLLGISAFDRVVASGFDDKKISPDHLGTTSTILIAGTLKAVLTAGSEAEIATVVRRFPRLTAVVMWQIMRADQSFDPSALIEMILPAADCTDILRKIVYRLTTDVRPTLTTYRRITMLSAAVVYSMETWGA